MKRVLTILTLLVYFTVSTGFVVNLHYCMDRFQSWELGGSGQRDGCSKCGMSKKAHGCCQDQVKLVKVNQDAARAQLAVYDFSIPAILPGPPAVPPVAVLQLLARGATPIHGPPLIGKQDTYLRHCVFLI